MRSIAVLLVCFASLHGCGTKVNVGAVKNDEWADVKAEGARAFLLDIPPDANPYIGSSESYSVHWLKGYMNAKESAIQSKSSTHPASHDQLTPKTR